MTMQFSQTVYKTMHRPYVNFRDRLSATADAIADDLNLRPSEKDYAYELATGLLKQSDARRAFYNPQLREPA